MLLTFIVLGLVVLFLVVSLLKEKINVNENRIEVKDLVYPLFVSNDTIVSITLLERLPKVLRRSNGLSLGRVLKGYYKIIKSMDSDIEKATFYVRNREAKVIEIKTVKGLVYINRRNEIQTQELFDEMKNTVKMLKDNELNYNARPPRSLRSVAILLFVILLLLLPSLFNNYGNEVIVNDNYIDIKGDYAMEIPLSDIDTVMLVETLPVCMSRINSISTRKVDIGKFRTADGEKCRLYINKSTPLYIEIHRDVNFMTKGQKLIFINRKTVEETKILYEEIIDNVQK